MKHLLSASLLLAFGIALAEAQPKLIRVPQDQPTVQAGIDAAVNGDTVLVAEGTYNVNLVLAKKIVLGSLYIVDGDTSHISQTILDGGTPAIADSASVIRIGPGTDTTTVVAGFTIRNGRGTIAQDQVGQYLAGGGVYLSGGARITRNIITGNSLTSSTRIVIGGGIGANAFPTSPVFWIIAHNRISNNVISYTGTRIGAEGGGVTMTQAGRFENNIVEDNVVNSSSPNIAAGAGGFAWEAQIGVGAQALVIANNLIRNNVARLGGGLLIAAASYADYPVCSMVNNIVADNRAIDRAGAMRIPSGRYTLVNNTITGNVCPVHAVGLTADLGPLTFTMLNNILWNPSTTVEFNNPQFVVGNYNNVRGGLTGTGNIGSDPRFIPGDPLYRLANNSPGIGAGAANAVLGGADVTAPAIDYLGLPRPQPVSSSPDLGAIEHGRSTPAGIIRVPQDQPTVQAGIDAAIDGDTVLVAEGTYVENIRLNKKIVIGSMFIVDGDVSHMSKTILDGSSLDPDSASVILVRAGTDSTTVISGFTIQNGAGTRGYDGISSYWRCGGGILFLGGGARISHNVIANNSLSASELVWGGGIAMWPLEGPITDWIIEHNQITNNVITSPNAKGAEGGGVFLVGNGRFSRNVVMNNAAISSNDGFAGGIAIGGEPGRTYNIELSNNMIRGNRASLWGGGIGCAVASSISYLSVTLTNNIISDNSASVAGGAMHAQGGTYSFINNTIVNNVGPQAIEAESWRGALTMRFLNNIIWNPGNRGEIVYTRTTPAYPHQIEVSYSDVRGGYAGTGNLDADPLLVSGDSLAHLTSGSPCIGRGSDSTQFAGVWYHAPEYDFDGDRRPAPGYDQSPDMGAQEEQVTVDVSQPIAVPSTYELRQNYPNPFNPATVLGFDLPIAAHVRLVVYDLLGREVAVMVNEERTPGTHEVRFDGAGLASGVYVYRLSAGEFVQTRKMTLLK